jgi:hypothetical protein
MLRTPFRRRWLAARRPRRPASDAEAEVVRAKGQAEQQMRFFDQLGPQARETARRSRFDADAVEAWQYGYRNELTDVALAQHIAAADAHNSGRFGPPAPAGV